MKSPVLSAFAIVISMINLVAQTNQTEDLNPIPAKVYELQEANVKFLKLNAFPSIGSRERVEIPELINNDGWLIKPDLVILKAIGLKKPQALELTIPAENGEDLNLLLYKVKTGTDDFKITLTDGRLVTKEPGTNYHGIIKGDNNSFVAISVFDDQVIGLLCNSSWNINLGLVRGDNEEKLHIIYNDKKLMAQSKFNCGTVNKNRVDMNIEPSGGNRSAGDCVTVHYEVDKDLYNFHGYPGVLNWITGLTNQVNAFNSNQGIKTHTRHITIWTTNSPYTGSDSHQRLASFEANTDDMDADVALLLDNHDTYGGLAYVQGLCQTNPDYSKGYGGLEVIYFNIPMYSLSVLVTAHELGHLLGSDHTHACVWNGNGTAIDGCSAPVGCPNPGLPPLGTGTVMSYCHTVITGTNLGLGYGPQPKQAILNNIASQECLFQACAECTSCPLVGMSIVNTGCDSKGTCMPNDDVYNMFLKVLHNNCAARSPDASFTVTLGVNGSVYGPFFYEDGTITEVPIPIPYGIPSTNIHVSDSYFNCTSDFNYVIPNAPLPHCSNYSLPTITCPANSSVTCVSNATPGVTGSASGANCMGESLMGTYTDQLTAGSPSCINNQTITRTWKVTDANNGTKTCIQTITSNDNVAPVITICPPDYTVSCSQDITPPNYNQLGVTDNCTAGVQFSILSETVSSQICANNYIFTRVYKATDNCGNTATCAQKFKVEDLTAPTITCPANISASCASQDPPADITSPIKSDNCPGGLTVTVASDNVINFNCLNKYTRERVYKVTDACNNTKTCLQTITINDLTPPTIICPANISVSCTSLVPSPNIGSVTTSDNCAGTVTVIFVNDVISAQTCLSRFTITRTYRATDVCGNSANCTQTIIVNDNIAPVITCPAPVTVSCVSQVPPANPSFILATDNCGSPTVSFVSDVVSSQTCTHRYTITRTYMATDACGNTATCSQIIIVNDQTAPVITCPAPLTVSCATLVPPVNIATVSATDNCTGNVTISFVSEVITNQTCINRYTITRTYRATDVCGNSSTCLHVITVNDITAPNITCPQNLDLVCASQVPAANIGSVISSDNCNQIPIISFVGDVISNQTCPNNFLITRTYRSTDACGNSATCTQLINVSDKIPPVLLGVPINMTIDCSDPVPVAATVSATDNCAGAVNISFAETSTKTNWNQLCSSISYDIQRTWTATDVCGNKSTKFQIIKVTDTKAPEFIKTPPQFIHVECDEDNDNNVDPIAVDDCDQTTEMLLDINYIPYLNECVNSYTAVYTWTAGDNCGNTSKYTQYIYVEDTEAPAMECPKNIEVKSDVPLNITWKSPKADDYCDGLMNPIQIQGPSNGSLFYPNTTSTIVYSITDGCGNITTCSFQVKVNSGNKPGEGSEVLLFQNEPNPFESQTLIKFSLPADMYIELIIYDLTGQIIKEFKGNYKAGLNEIALDASDLFSAGMYIYQLNAGGIQKTKKMIFIY